MFTKIIEPGLELRPYEERLVEQVYAAVDADRAYLRRFLPWAGKADVESTRAFIRQTLQQIANNDGFQCGIWLDGQYVGGIGVHGIKWDHHRTEIGYWLADGMQGRGIMTKACRVILNHAFNEWKLQKVEIRCDPENTRSRAIPLRLGFTEEGTLRQILLHGDGTLHDGVVYGLLASEWKSA